MTVELLKNQYNMVFDANGDVKLCGRDACCALIALLSAMYPSDDPLYFGNVQTGYMNVDNIKSIYANIIR